MITTDDQQEMFVVVDENDTILEYRSRYDCHHDKTLIHRTIGVLIYNDKGQILLQKRSMTKDLDPGKWGISVGGHVTKGQTYEEAAAREMEEELGIHAKLTPIKKWIMRSGHESEMGMLYTAHHNGPFTYNMKEIDRVEFFDIYNLPENLSHCTKLTLKEVGIL